MNKKALGLIETYGYIGSIEASDTALKTADVELVGIEFVKGGIVAVKFIGDVGAVKASIEGGKAAAEKLGVFLSSHVIPRLSEDAYKVFLEQPENKVVEEIYEEKENLNEDEVENESQEDNNKEDNENEINEIQTSENNKISNTVPYKKTKEELNSMKVVKLRNLARKMDGISIERNEIKFANKKQLIDAISEYYERKMK